MAGFRLLLAMRYFVTVRTRAREDRIETIDANHFAVSVKVAPIEGKANQAVRRILARSLGLAPSSLRLIAGETGKKKVFAYGEK
ncbi:MAG: DUF167 domain-containing protein [Undibacterium sp.]